MVLISFSVLKERVKLGAKRQTIRLLKKDESSKWRRVLKNYNEGKEIQLQLYWKSRSKTEHELLRKDPLKKIYPKYLSEITEQEAIQDGFIDLLSLRTWFRHTYRKVNFEEQELAIIQW